MNLKEALKRIEQLEREVEQLKARKPEEVHNHFYYHNPPNVYPYIPQQPQFPPWNPLTPWCGAATNG